MDTQIHTSSFVKSHRVISYDATRLQLGLAGLADRLTAMGYQ